MCMVGFLLCIVITLPSGGEKPFKSNERTFISEH